MEKEIYRPSEFWIQENRRHEEQLKDAGFTHFKRSVNVRYFNWRTLGILRHQMQPVIQGLMSGNCSPFFESEFKNPRRPQIKNITHFHGAAAFLYQIFVAYLYEFVKKDDRLQLLEHISEPALGDPFLVEYKRRPRSQDLCNSVHEFYSVVGPAALSPAAHIAELGAGYGRTAYVFLNAMPQAKYCIIDIPPALTLSQEYLSKVFPGERIFGCRPFTDFAAVEEEFNASRIRFLMPGQMELLPPKMFDLVVNISSLHEMRRDQIENFLRQIDRLGRGYFYTKQWQRSMTQDNDYIRMDEYPIPSAWMPVYQRAPHPIQSMFFDALYKIA